MKRINDEDAFDRWMRGVEDSIRQLKQGRNLGTKQAERFQVGRVVFFTETQPDGSENIYVKHAQSASGNRLLLGNVTKG